METMETINVSEIATAAAAAKRAALALTEALGGSAFCGPSADAYCLDGTWYVVTSGTGEGCDFAYLADSIVVDTVAAEDWDYSEWCIHISPVRDVRVAVAYYLLTGREIGENGSCRLLLTDDQIMALRIAQELGHV